ncbi:MAG: 16S rRNA (cytidine(1402)-2'-O)-methyltransferase, partial [Nitrospirae bacterium]|nr:16S rRNA (cytidine(1402)-2'-O)-methyltransferase [Nitrospirota bacterium]
GSTKGEFTIILHGATGTPAGQHLDTKEYLKDLMLHRRLSKKEAIAVAAHDLGVPKKEIYKIGLTIKEED